MAVAAHPLRRLIGCPAVTSAVLFLLLASLCTASAAPADKPVGVSAVTPNSLSGLGSYPGAIYPGGSYPGASYPGASYPGASYPGANYPGASYPGASYPGAGYPGASYPGGTYPGGTYPGGTYPGGTYPGGTMGGYPGSTSTDACTLCYWRTYYTQWYMQTYGIYEKQGYDPCYVCTYSGGVYAGRR